MMTNFYSWPTGLLCAQLAISVVFALDIRPAIAQGSNESLCDNNGTGAENFSACEARARDRSLPSQVRAVANYNWAQKYRRLHNLYNINKVSDIPISAEPKNYEPAIEHYSASISLWPTYYDAHYNRAQVYLLKHDYVAAIGDLTFCLQNSDGREGVPYTFRGISYLGAGNIENAIADFNAALKWNDANAGVFSSPQNKLLNDSPLLYGRGLAKRKLGDTSGGDEDIAKAVMQNADIVKFFANFGLNERNPRSGTAPAATQGMTPKAIAVPAPPAAAPPSDGVWTTIKNWFGGQNAEEKKQQADTTAPLSPTADCSQAEIHWKSAETLGILAGYEDHLKRFPNCAFATLAQAKISALKQQVVAATPSAPQPSGQDGGGYLGIKMQDRSRVSASTWGMPDNTDKKITDLLFSAQGAVVISVEPNSPAEKAGIERTDIITKFNDREVLDIRDFAQWVKETKPGTVVTVTLNRRGFLIDRQSIKVTLGQRPDEGSSSVAPAVATSVNSLVGKWGPVNVQGSCVTSYMIISDNRMTLVGEGSNAAKAVSYTFDGSELIFTHDDGRVVHQNFQFVNADEFVMTPTHFKRCRGER